MGAPCAGRLEHINFGKVQGMSTRNGEVKFLDEILDMAQEAMFTQMSTNEHKFSDVDDPTFTSDQIGMTCVKIQDMQAKRSITVLIIFFLNPDSKQDQLLPLANDIV